MLLLSALVLVSLAGCNRGRGQTNETEDVALEQGGGEEAPVTALPDGWTRVLVIGPGTGPGLYFAPEERAPAFGYLNPGVRIRLESGSSNNRMEALVAGPMATKGWVPADRISAYVQRRGRVEGTPYYVGPNDFATVLGPAEQAGQMRVAVRPWLGGGTFLDARTGTFATDGLADRTVDLANAEAPTPGDCYRVPAGQTVAVYDRPGGQEVAQLPASDPGHALVVLRAREPWYGVRAGYGPYVVGYVQGPLTACDGPRPEPQPMVQRSAEGQMPYWMTQESGALHRVASGTRVRFNGRTVARLRQDGWARELGREENDLVDVFVAIDDTVALRGLVPASSLTLVEGTPGQAPAPPAQQEPEEEEDLPDELAD
jgi:hypothetical protein